MIVAVIAVLLAMLIPRAVLATAAGVVFGAVPGALYVPSRALLAAAIAFGVGRVLGRDFVRSRPRAYAVDRLLQRRGFVAVLAVRSLAVAPFELVGDALGASGVRISTYLAATLVGTAPGAVLFASTGASALAPASPWLYRLDPGRGRIGHSQELPGPARCHAKLGDM